MYMIWYIVTEHYRDTQREGGEKAIESSYVRCYIIGIEEIDMSSQLLSSSITH
jgi:hypothetical protein